MSRDMQIGLLLAVGFLALVGGVLYYRIEHPDELEQYLNGGSQAQATSPTAPDTSHPDTAPSTVAGGTPAKSSPPAMQPPPMETTPLLGSNTNPPPLGGNTPTNTTPSSGGGSTTGSNVVLASGNGTGNATTPPALTTPPSLGAPPASNTTAPSLAAAPILDFSALDKKPAETKPAAVTPAEEKKPDAGSNSRSSLPVEPPSNTLPSAPPSSAPSLASGPSLALESPGKTTAATTVEQKKPEEKKVEEKKPLDIVIKPDNMTPPAMTPPSMTPPLGGNTTTPSNTNPPNDATAKTSSTTGATDLNKSQELPQPPVVTAPNAGILFDDKPKNTAPGNATTTSANNGSSSLNAPPANMTSPLGANPASDADGFRSYPAKGTLGKPMPESEAALREKRWAESAGNPAPIIPSSSEWSGSSTRSNSSVPANRVDRKVVRDTYIPTERAQRGETFSSLSQRLYGDTNYAVALAAFNKEEGFVKMDQPEANEWVAKPNREILDQRYPNLIRRLSPSQINNLRNNATVTGGTGAAPASTAATTNHPTYRVGKGEQLFEVAKKALGDGYRWSEIYELNKDQLRESTELRPDMVLKLPAEGKK